MALPRKKGAHPRPAPWTAAERQFDANLTTLSGKSAQRSAVRAIRGQTARRAKAFHSNSSGVIQLAKRIAERPAGDRHLRSARLTFPLCIVSDTRLCCSSKSIAATAKPARPAMFRANTSLQPIPRERCFHLPQRFSFANASGKFEQRLARIVVFDLDASIFFSLPT
jgi:hypothetical protein